MNVQTEQKILTKQLKNINKFPEDFYFQLTNEEYNNLKFHFGTSSSNNHGGVRKMPHAFTEQGVAMLASVINTPIADDISVKIINAFVTMRHILLNNIDHQKELYIMQNRILEHDNKLLEHENKIDSLIDKFSTEDIFKDKMIFKGEFYDGYSLILDIFNKAKEEILIIDNYCDKKVLDIVCKLNIRVTIISGNMDKDLINKYQKQYNNLTIINDDSFHDRFIVTDKVNGYHLGSSIKDIGNKVSYIDTIDKKWLDILLKEIKNEN